MHGGFGASPAAIDTLARLDLVRGRGREMQPLDHDRTISYMSRTIIVIGLGPGSPDALSLGALNALHKLRDGGAPVFARTIRHPTLDWLTENENIVVTGSFDSLYERGESFDDVYAGIVSSLIEAVNVHEVIGYVVPGHPRFGERSIEMLELRAAQEGFSIEMIGSQSYLDAVLAAEMGPTTPMRVLDALDLIHAPGAFEAEPEPLDPSALHVIYQVYDRYIASDLKIALLEMYPPDARVIIVTAAGVAGLEKRTERALSELDRSGVEFDHLTTVLLRPLGAPELFTGYIGLLHVMAHLRNPDGGCPWDREQTPETLRRYLLEETYEVLDAIGGGDPLAYADELGDLLLQVVFHAQLARERGEFTMRDILRSIVSKLVRRHPHVFGDVVAKDAADVLFNWAAIKKVEKGAEERTSILDGVPRSMPSLMRAQEISRRAAKAGFEWESIDGVFAKLDEEIQELRDAIASDNADEIEAELGDLLFTAVNLARFRKVDAESALGAMVERFKARFHNIEGYALREGRALADLSLDEMEAVWQASKEDIVK
jgi:tetrapyrrole methylase family protein/MazG family protein